MLCLSFSNLLFVKSLICLICRICTIHFGVFLYNGRSLHSPFLKKTFLVGIKTIRLVHFLSCNFNYPVYIKYNKIVKINTLNYEYLWCMYSFWNTLSSQLFNKLARFQIKFKRCVLRDLKQHRNIKGVLGPFFYSCFFNIFVTCKKYLF